MKNAILLFLLFTSALACNRIEKIKEENIIKKEKNEFSEIVFKEFKRECKTWHIVQDGVKILHIDFINDSEESLEEEFYSKFLYYLIGKHNSLALDDINKIIIEETEFEIPISELEIAFNKREIFESDLELLKSKNGFVHRMSSNLVLDYDLLSIDEKETTYNAFYKFDSITNLRKAEVLNPNNTINKKPVRTINFSFISHINETEIEFGFSYLFYEKNDSLVFFGYNVLN